MIGRLFDYLFGPVGARTVVSEDAARAALARIVAHPECALPYVAPARGRVGPAVEDLRMDFWRVTEARHAPAIPVLARLWAEGSWLAADLAGGALVAIDTKETHAIVRGVQAHVTARGVSRWVGASLLADASAGIDEVERLVTRGKAGDERALAMAACALREAVTLAGVARARVASSPILADADRVMARVRAEPRWLELAARHRRDEVLGEAARDLLRGAPRAARRAALARHPAAPPPTPKTSLDVLGPYRSASRETPSWDELVALGPIEGPLRETALRVARTRMERVARNADRIAANLRAMGWPLHDHARRSAHHVPEARNAFTGEVRMAHDVDVDALLADTERRIGGRLPVALEAYWRGVGQIDFSPVLDAELPDWVDDVDVEELDPLVVWGPDFVLGSVDDWCARVEEAGEPELADPLALEIAPDRFHKMGISGGGPYEIAVPDARADPPVLGAPETLPLLAYLEHAIAWGGMPGLARSAALSPRVVEALASLRTGLD